MPAEGELEKLLDGVRIFCMASGNIDGVN